jgi:alpha-galactosidase
MDVRYLTPAEKREVKDQIAFYKAHRKTLQYGMFRRLTVPKTNKTAWLCRGTEEAVAGFFQTTVGVCEGPDVLCIPGMDPDTQYRVSTRPQKLYIKRFGGLVKHLLPFSIDPGGLLLRAVNRHYALTGCVETHDCSGSALAAGVMLYNQFMGNNYNDKTRLLGDYGSELYTIAGESRTLL